MSIEIRGLLVGEPTYVIDGASVDALPRAVRDPDGRDWPVLDAWRAVAGLVCVRVAATWAQLSCGGRLRLA